MNAAEFKALIRESIAESREEAQARARQEAQAHRSPVEPFVQGRLSASLVGFESPLVFAPVLQVGGGARWRKLYARLDLGLAVGSTGATRLGGELLLALGYVHAPWLQAGLVGGARLSGPGLSSPWLERTWTVGVEGAHCLWAWQGFDLCLTESVRPGVRTRRGEVAGGEVFRLPDRSGFALVVDVGLVLRREL